MPYHVDKFCLIRFVIVPLARLRAMINELAERVCVIGPQTQCITIGGDRACEIAEFSPSVSQIVKCFGKIRPLYQRLLERRPRFVSTPFRQ